MCFGSTATDTVKHTSVAPGFEIEETCGSFQLVKIITNKQSAGWFTTEQEAIDASHKG